MISSWLLTVLWVIHFFWLYVIIWIRDSLLFYDVTVDLDGQEKHYKRLIEQMKIDHEKEIYKLKQENFVLSAKVSRTVYLI